MCNDVDSNPKADSAQQGGNKMNSIRPKPIQEGVRHGVHAGTVLIAYNEPMRDKEIVIWKGRVGLSSVWSPEYVKVDSNCGTSC